MPRRIFERINSLKKHSKIKERGGRVVGTENGLEFEEVMGN